MKSTVISFGDKADNPLKNNVPAVTEIAATKGIMKTETATR